jgi:CII-binding regulator of phage lambda lysogenization HflD
MLAVEIDAISHQLGLYGYAVMVELVVGIYVRAVSPLGDRIAMAHLRALVEHGITGTE